MKTLFLLATLVAIAVYPRAARAACEEPAKVADLSHTASMAEQAFANLDAETLLTQASIARAQILPCVDGVLTRRDAAAFHRLMAMEAFINGNYSRVKQELHAALMLEPGYVFPESVASQGHPLLKLYQQAATLPDGEAEKIYSPANGYVIVGGVRNAARYSQTPVIIQVFMADGELRETRYVRPGEAAPNWSGNAFGITAEDIGINVEDFRREPVLKDPRGWYIAAGVAAVTSGVFYGIAMSQKAQYQDPLTPDERLAGLEGRANGLGAASLATGISAAVFTGMGVGVHIAFGPHVRRSAKPADAGGAND